MRFLVVATTLVIAAGLRTPVDTHTSLPRRAALSTIAAVPAAAALPLPSFAKSRDEYSVQTIDGRGWKEVLSGGQYFVLRDGGTEPPNSSPLVGEKRRGVFVCAGCVAPLFDSTQKFESGTGWPSFAAPRAAAVDTIRTMFGSELRCARCGGHLGDVFADGSRFPGACSFVSHALCRDLKISHQELCRTTAPRPSI